jgi:hypothetical protein
LAVIQVSPSKVRVRALHEYELLRHTIDEMDGIAVRLLMAASDRGSAVDEALAITTKLLRELSDYVDLEQLFVLPTIRRVDVWGTIRADALARDHASQHDDLRAIEQAHQQPIDPQQLAGDLRKFVQSLREVLEREERDVLGPNALRDDVVDSDAD